MTDKELWFGGVQVNAEDIQVEGGFIIIGHCARFSCDGCEINPGSWRRGTVMWQWDNYRGCTGRSNREVVVVEPDHPEVRRVINQNIGTPCGLPEFMKARQRIDAPVKQLSVTQKIFRFIKRK